MSLPKGRQGQAESPVKILLNYWGELRDLLVVGRRQWGGLADLTADDLDQELDPCSEVIAGTSSGRLGRACHCGGRAFRDHGAAGHRAWNRGSLAPKKCRIGSKLTPARPLSRALH